jgi:hypothetical protein
MYRNVSNCPPATQDIGLNLRNRQNCIRVAKYGPANPSLPNKPFWSDKANMWGTTVAEAKTMRCGNCAAFNVSPRMQACIAAGIGNEGIDPYDMVAAGHLGYCEMFKFKCAAGRTCDAWVVGGPITAERLVRRDR